MKTYMVRGVPQKLQQDGWWFSPSRDADPTGACSGKKRRFFVQIAALLSLILLADVLFWQTSPGVSLAVFAALLVGVAFVFGPNGFSLRKTLLVIVFTALSVLPVAELVQPLSLLFLVAGISTVLTWMSGHKPWCFALLWWRGLQITEKEARSGLGAVAKTKMHFELRAFALRWGLPAGVGCVFTALLLEANPVFSVWVSQLADFDLVLPPGSRVLFWGGILLLCAPVLAFSEIPGVSAARFHPRQGPVRLPAIINAPAILRSLCVFNLLFGVQNALDLSVLVGGAGLPDGITHAEYAQQGAYSLVALALLSGCFALVARPFVPGSPLIRALLLIWVAQTLWLCASSALRLDLYVTTFGLTRLRMAAGIWLLLVTTGLGLVLFQIWRAHDNAWLLRRAGAVGLITLYLCCFVSFDREIARFNLTTEAPLDRYYVCSLGEAAAPAITKHSGMTLARFCLLAPTHPVVSRPQDWREWGFRNARVRRSLAQSETAAQATR